MSECSLDQFLNGVRLSSSDHVIVGIILLQHQPHRANVVSSKTPVALRIEIAEAKFVGKSEFDFCSIVCYFPSNKFHTAPWRFVVEKDAAVRVQAVALAVVDGDPVPINLSNTIRTARVERRVLALRNFLNLAENFRRGRLVEPNVLVDMADSVKDARHAERSDIPAKDGLGPGGLPETC